MKTRGVTFASSVFFAALAGLAAVPYLMVGVPVLGATAALSLGCVALVATYLFVIAPSRSHGVRIALLGGALGSVAMIVAPDRTSAVLIAAVLVAVLRSGFLYRSRPARALVLETVLMGMGFVLASVLGGGGVLHVGLEVWCFFLVQSVFFLVGGVDGRKAEDDGVDPFVKARDAASRLMDDVGVTG